MVVVQNIISVIAVTLLEIALEENQVKNSTSLRPAIEHFTVVRKYVECIQADAEFIERLLVQAAVVHVRIRHETVAVGERLLKPLDLLRTLRSLAKPTEALLRHATFPVAPHWLDDRLHHRLVARIEVVFIHQILILVAVIAVVVIVQIDGTPSLDHRAEFAFVDARGKD